MINTRPKIRRLPGFSFEAQAPPREDVLPRMDVAVFIGFTAAGPINVPVVVESVEQFAAVFGADLPLAWDKENCKQIYAYLAPAVRAFFRNGGARCWIVRVARGAQSNRFPIAGLVCARFSASGIEITPALAQARASGSWSDNLEVSAALSARRVKTGRLINTNKIGVEIELEIDKNAPLVIGETLRFNFADGKYVLLINADEIINDPPSSRFLEPNKRRVHVKSRRAVWQTKFDLSGSPPGVQSVSVRFWTREASGSVLPSATSEIDFSPQAARPVGEIFNAHLTSLGNKFQLDFAQMPANFSLPTGSLGVIDLPDGQLCLQVESVGSGELPAMRRVTAIGVFVSETPPDFVNASPFVPVEADEIELLDFELWVKTGDGSLIKLDKLAFADARANFWGNLPTDEQLYRFEEQNKLKPAAIQVWRQTGDLFRFPLAGAVEKTDDFYFPLLMPFIPQNYLGAIHSGQTKLERDGLASFDAGLFLDEKLAVTGFGDLLNEAEFVRYLSPRPRSLDGIHAALAPETIVKTATDNAAPDAIAYTNLSLEEATIILVPDAAHRGWNLAGPESAAAPVVTSPPIEDLKLGEFQDCESGKHFEQSETKKDDSPITSEKRWLVKAEKDFEPNVLLTVQRALLRLCAARGDIFAVLSLPEHYRQDETLKHIAALKGNQNEPQILSFGAIYHPWLVQREDATADLRNVPPCGAASGVLANRAGTRGAWIAPANEPLRGVLALTSIFEPESFLDFQASQINLVRQEPTGFLVLNADTLSDDVDLREINVRRLLSLLRRIALKHGAEYVFEPNDERLRRAVERGFASLLDQMFARGAFAGNTPSASYQVVVSEVLNNRQSVEQGRFICELRVAPSFPLKFVTVRLLQTGGRSFVTERR
ncbi:MAG: hypothetical protein ABI954_10935 [Pyrinomonadaceae bacterium]